MIRPIAASKEPLDGGAQQIVRAMEQQQHLWLVGC